MSAGPRGFVEWTDPDDPSIPVTALRWVELTRDDLGRELARFRPWASWRRLGLVLLVDAVLAAPFLALLGPDPATASFR